MVRYADLPLLVIALGVFIAADLPALGFAVAAAAWIAQRAISAYAERRTKAALAAGDRRTAFRTTAVSTLGRVWLVSASVLLVGLLADREDGARRRHPRRRAVHRPVRRCRAFASDVFRRRRKGHLPLSTKAKVWLAVGIYLGITVILLLLLGNEGRNEHFQPQNEFKLEPWIEIEIAGIDFSINRAVFYLALASVLTISTMVFLANRMQREPNKVQMAVELVYDLVRNNITRGNIPDEELARRWFPYIAGLFFFIWFSNLLGYLPLPTNTEHTVNIFGLELPTLAIYAATANISIPVVLALVSTVAYHVEGIRKKGFFPYLASWLPAGLESMNPFGKAAIWLIEAVSHFVRPISLSVRLFANILAGHLLILFMAGGLAVLLGLAALGALTFPMAFAFFVFEIGLVATLQAFIFSTLTAIYIGGATAEAH
jgi:F0F1-type ATP synthase, subunit a